MNPQIQKRKNSGRKQAVYKKKDNALSIIQSILSAKNYPTRKIKISRKSKLRENVALLKIFKWL